MADQDIQVPAQAEPLVTTAPAAAPQAPVAEPAAPAAPVTPAPAPAQPAVETNNDRTRQEFEKILDNNRQLFQANEHLRRELQQKAQAQAQFAPIQQQPVAQPVAPQVDPRDFIEVDANGDRFINEQKLRSRVQQLEDQTTRAQQAVQSYIQSAEQREIARQEVEAFGSYQELNPASPAFDKGFSDVTRAIITDSLVNPQDYGGRPLSFKQAADIVVARGVQPQSRMNNQTVQTPASQAPVEPQPEDKTQLKEVASATPAGQPAGNERARIDSDEQLRSLQEETRKGSNEALAIRLANVDHLARDSEAS